MTFSVYILGPKRMNSVYFGDPVALYEKVCQT